MKGWWRGDFLDTQPIIGTVTRLLERRLRSVLTNESRVALPRATMFS